MPADVLVSGGADAECIELMNRARNAGLNVVVDLQQRHGEELWQLAQHQRIGCAVDYSQQAILLWMAGGDDTGASCGECTRAVLWQQLQRLALAKAARNAGSYAAPEEVKL